MSEPILRTQGLTRRFGGLVAVDDLSFSLAGSRLHAIIGPNGAGKTTFFNLVSECRDRAQALPARISDGKGYCRVRRYRA